MLKDHLTRTAEKCCKLLGTQVDRVLGPPRTDKLSATRLSLALVQVLQMFLDGKGACRPLLICYRAG